MKTPLYLSIAKELEKKILDNSFKKNERLPAERALAEEYDVNRVTIRKAIDSLVQKGLLEKRMGSGNYVKRNSLNLNMNEQMSFSEKIELLGQEAKTEIIKFERILGNEELCKTFNSDSGTEFFHIKRLRYVNNEVVNIENTYLPCSMFPDLTSDIMKSSKYDYVEKYITIKESYNKIMPIMPDEETKKLFALDKCEPIFFKTSIGISKNNEVFEYSELYFNPKVYEFTFISKR